MKILPSVCFFFFFFLVVKELIVSQELGFRPQAYSIVLPAVSQYAIPAFIRNGYLIFLFKYFRIIEGPDFKRL